MKRNVFGILLVLGGLLFVALSLGGCGGSSSSTGGGSNDSNLTMSEVWDENEAMQEVFNCLTSEDIFKLLALRIEGIEQRDDGSVIMQYFNTISYLVSDEKYPEVPYNKDELLAHYDSGDIILIWDADQTLVNTVRSDLGLSEEDSDTFGQSGSLEVYGLACIKTDGLRNLFVYVVPRMGDIVASADVQEDNDDDTETGTNDLESDDVLYESDDVSGESKVVEEYTMRDFQIERWVNFFKWIGNVAVDAVNNSAFAASYQVKAADNDLAVICDAQSKVFDFSYANQHTNGPKFNGVHYECTEFNRTRNNFVSVKIFAAHSFSNGRDYYIVENTAETEPKNFSDEMIEYNGYRRNYIYGFTRSVGTEFHIDGGEMSINDAALIHNAPAVEKITESYSENISWPINGKFGVNKNGASVGISGDAMYSKSKTWAVSEYNILNSSTEDYPASAKWHVDVERPVSKGERGSKEYRTWYISEAVNASINPLQYDTYFMWEVGRDYWKNNPDMKMNLKFTVVDGSYLGACRKTTGSISGIATYKRHKRKDLTYTTTKMDSLKLEQPPHTVADKTNFEFPASGASAHSFTILAEDNWTITDVPSWLHFTSTSGNATGSTESQVLFDVDENPNTETRQAIVTLKSGRDTINLTVRQAGK